MVNFLLDRQPISSFVDVELLDLAADKGNKRIVTLLVEVAVHTAEHQEEIAVWALKRRSVVSLSPVPLSQTPSPPTFIGTITFFEIYSKLDAILTPWWI